VSIVHRLPHPLAQALNVLGDRTTLLLLGACYEERRRLSELHFMFRDISRGALDTALRHACEHGLLERRRFNESPPRVMYEVTHLGREAFLTVGFEMSRFGEMLMRDRGDELPHNCERALEAQLAEAGSPDLKHPTWQTGTTLECPCGRVYVHICNEVEGCGWEPIEQVTGMLREALVT